MESSHVTSRIWTSQDLAQVLDFPIDPSISSGIVQFNSKHVQQGDLFIALPGANGDGHNFVPDALTHGATVVIMDKLKCPEIIGPQILRVDDTLTTLQKMAEYKRQHLKSTHVIAVTGSVGKTTTKDAIGLILKNLGATFVSRGNFNNFLGLLLNLASLPEPEVSVLDYAVFELGMNHKNELRTLTNFLKPTVAILTNISEAHVGHFESMEELADAKCEIFEGLPKNGTAVVNLDSPHFDRVIQKLDQLKIFKIRTFGWSPTAHARLISWEIEPMKLQSKLTYLIGTQEICTTLPFLVPRQFAQNFAGALLTAQILKINVVEASTHLKKFELTEGRGRIIEISKWDKKFKIICDYYNSSPEALKASLNFLRDIQIQTHTKVAIIGDMLELGHRSRQLHEEIVPFIVSAGVSKVFLVGEYSKFIGYLLPPSVAQEHFENVEEVTGKLINLVEDNQIILIKGSRSMELERIVEFLRN